MKGTTALKKILRLKKKTKIIQGGQGAGKTYSILLILINIALSESEQVITIIGKSVPKINRGLIRDFIKIMHNTKRFKATSYNRTSKVYQFGNGSIIEFVTGDEPDKFRGSRRDYLYINECESIDFELYVQTSVRTKRSIYLDYNPSHEFWIEEVKELKTSDFLVLTYKDNEYISEQEKATIESRKDSTDPYWSNWYKVYGLGQMGKLSGVIFANWEKSERPNNFKNLGLGLDFGYSQDPLAIVDVWRLGNEIYVEEVMYQTHVSNSELIKVLKEKGKEVIADHEVRTIEEVRKAGVNIKKATKTKVIEGIRILQDYKILVNPKSTNLINELNGYRWREDSPRGTEPKPKGADHLLDALRYRAIYNPTTITQIIQF